MAHKHVSQIEHLNSGSLKPTDWLTRLASISNSMRALGVELELTNRKEGRKEAAEEEIAADG